MCAACICLSHHAPSPVFSCFLVYRTKKIKYTADELAEWESNPEDFIHEQDTDAWTIKMKQCAETLYISLLQQRQEWTTPVVVQLLHRIVILAHNIIARTHLAYTHSLILSSPLLSSPLILIPTVFSFVFSLNYFPLKISH